MTLTKICGLTDPDMVSFAAGEGADWIGVNFIPASPRFVRREAAAALLGAMGAARAVALLADPSVEEVMETAALGFP
ncbi:MAG TPA: N-(5'-phosphoribosyl)anthranilate isomerase, partial [Hyphomonas sp.]|nr:N-(5'-phosphoribosyl)anthranilate isomerase [Hyphomonas sp.]